MDCSSHDTSRNLPIEPEIEVAGDDFLLHTPPPTWKLLAAMAIGGVAGTLFRVKIALLIVASSTGIPWATFLVNTLGAVMLGVVLAVLSNRHRSAITQALLATGLCGSLTTFSTLLWQADNLARIGRWWFAIGYVALSLVTGLFAVASGMAVGRRIAQRPATQ